MQYNKKLCPAIVGMYYYVDGVTSPTEISRATGWRVSSVWEILKRKYGETTTRRKCDDALIVAIERDYISGISTYEIADKYGVDHSTISKWMKKRGHTRGKGYIPEERRRAYAESHRKLVEQKEEQKNARRLKREEESRERRIERQAELDRRAAKRDALHAAELAKEKVCASCGAVFHSEYATQLYCSDTCKRREKRRRDVASGKTKLNDYGNHRRRARKHGASYEPGITLSKLIERDGNTCQICGGQCDATDLRYGSSGPLYPSIDHIKPIAKGGSHTWDNVQLAHMICNSKKRDIYDAEEQTARNVCS